MSAHASVTLAPHGLELRCPGAGLREDRPLAADDVPRLEAWARRYLDLAGKDDHHQALLQLGQELHD